MKFIDKAKIFVRSGNGGNGCVSFRREKFIPKGGPDGGDGGKGGDIIFVCTKLKETLIDFKYKAHFKAQDGEGGKGCNCHGKNGKDVMIEIPLGTQIWDEKQEIMFFDAVKDGKKFIIQGGKGGVGNTRFATSTNQAPKIATEGETGEEGWINLVLKIFADIGFVGFPNAGKSSLLRIFTASRTAIGDYPFTTLHPELGAVWKDDKKLVMADLPGIIEEAHKGKGLGIEFLGHIERCKSILHLIDASEPDITNSYQILRGEIGSFSEKLLEKPEIIALNKVDLVNEQDLERKIQDLKTVTKNRIYKISCKKLQGTQELLNAIITQNIED